MAEDNSNGRVTLAKLGVMVEQLLQAQARIENKLDEQHDKLDSVCLAVEKHEGCINLLTRRADTNKDEIDRLRASSNWKDALTGMGTLVAGILAALGLTRS